MADASREEKLKAARETYKQLQKKKAGTKATPKAQKPKDDEKEPEASAPEALASPSIGAASPESLAEEFTATSSEPSVISATSTSEIEARYQSQLAEKDTLINSLRDETTSLKTQHENSQREVSRHATSLVSKDKEIATLKSTDSEKDSLISSLQLEIGQLKDQLSSLKESTGSAPTAEQFAALVSERDTLKAQVTDLENDSEKTHKQLQTLQNEHTALEKDTKTTHETLVNLRNEYAKLKESHSSEIQKSRLVQSRAAELQIENKTLMSRVDELKKKLVSLTTEKLELVERAETQERELYRLRRERMVVSSGGGGRGSVEMDTELDALIEGQKTRQAIRETNQRRYSQFVGQAVSEEAEGETMRDINERRLKKGKETGEFGREKETGFVVDLMSIGGGCGMCVGEALVL